MLLLPGFTEMILVETVKTPRHDQFRRVTMKIE